MSDEYMIVRSILTFGVPMIIYILANIDAYKKYGDDMAMMFLASYGGAMMMFCGVGVMMGFSIFGEWIAK